MLCAYAVGSYAVGFLVSFTNTASAFSKLCASVKYAQLQAKQLRVVRKIIATIPINTVITLMKTSLIMELWHGRIG
jgi:hypothetical protein